MISASKKAATRCLGMLALLVFAFILTGCGPSVEERKHIAATTNDQAVLMQMAIGDEDAEVREWAFNSVTDAGALELIALYARDANIRIQATLKLSDRPALMRVALQTDNVEVGKTAVDELHYADLADVCEGKCRQLLLKVALETDKAEIGEEAVKSLPDQRLLLKAAQTARRQEVRRAATARLNARTVAEITDAKLLTAVAFIHEDQDVRKAAIGKLTDQAVLYRLASAGSDMAIRTLAVTRITDQRALAKLAAGQPAAAIRRAAVSRVSNEDFLLARSRADSSKAVRLSAVAAMKDEAHLARVAIENDGEELRRAAAKRIRNPTFRAQVAAAERKLAAELTVIATADESAQVRSALRGGLDTIRLAAAKRLRRQQALGEVASRCRDRQVCKIVFLKLTDPQVLNEVAVKASDNAMRIAAKVKAGQLTWAQVFNAAAKKGAGPVALGEALAAVSFFPAALLDAKEGVVQTCLDFIRRGDETRIPELIDMLDQYGDVKLAEDYLNCGQPDLEAAATHWASARGYRIGSGAGSNRASWGSDR
jgi:hypothetical protein